MIVLQFVAHCIALVLAWIAFLHFAFTLNTGCALQLKADPSEMKHRINLENVASAGPSPPTLPGAPSPSPGALTSPVNHQCCESQSPTSYIVHSALHITKTPGPTTGKIIVAQVAQILRRPLFYGIDEKWKFCDWSEYARKKQYFVFCSHFVVNSIS